jgi:hypothetical protein
MKFLKVLEANLPETVTDDSIIFTETGKIYVNDSSGELVQVGGTGGVIIVDELPTDKLAQGTIYILNSSPPKMVTYINGGWWQTPMTAYIEE